MTEMFSTLGTWNWLIFGFILMALEVIAPGVFLFWLGLAALLVGLLSFVFTPSWQTQLLMFAVFAALNYFIADKYIKAFGQFAESPNQKVLMLPVEAMSLLSSLAGIGEIAKATFGESAVSAVAAARRSSVPPAGPTPPPVASQ